MSRGRPNWRSRADWRRAAGCRPTPTAAAWRAVMRSARRAWPRSLNWSVSLGERRIRGRSGTRGSGWRRRWAAADPASSPSWAADPLGSTHGVAVARAEETFHHDAFGRGVFQRPVPQRKEHPDEPLRGERVGIVVTKHLAGEGRDDG